MALSSSCTSPIYLHFAQLSIFYLPLLQLRLIATTSAICFYATSPTTALMSSSFASMPSRIPCRTTSTAGQLSTRSTFLLPRPIAAHADCAQRTIFVPYKQPRRLLLPKVRLGHEQYALSILLLHFPLRLLHPPHGGLEGKSGRPLLKEIVRTSDYITIRSLCLGRAIFLMITLLRTIVQPSN